MNEKVELLSPGGNLEKIKTAINYGADAVYCGYEKFSLRSRAGNLNKKALKEAINFTHKSGRKIYLTLNSYLFDTETDEMEDFLRFLSGNPVDALIISDLGVLRLANEISDIPVHISTQANITNAQAANFFKGFNVERVVIARELTIENIRDFVKKSDIKAEAFIHGAMCMSYSGRCFLSSYLTGRSANSGDCAQSCRWKYALVEEKRPNRPVYVEEHREGSFIFNSYDMCALPILDEIIDTGVESLKIEGRMKSVYYVAVSTGVYRSAIDDILEGRDFKHNTDFYMRELEKISHRPYSLGFYKNSPMQYLESSGYIRECDFVGVVEYCKESKIFIRVRNKIKPGRYEIITKTLEIILIDIDFLYDLNENKKTVGNPNEFLYIKSHIEVESLSILRKCES